VIAVATQSGDGGADHSAWLVVDLAWVEVAQAVLRLPGESTGADMEVRLANTVGIPIFSTVEQIACWRQQTEQREITLERQS
jgi:hypothetical protein